MKPAKPTRKPNPEIPPAEGLKPLQPAFFARNTLAVAKDLLGCYLVCTPPQSPSPLAFRITETEAYRQDDPACHGFGKTGKNGQPPKGRASTLFKSPGLSYVYFIYGMHYCLNVVTEAEGTGAAVLFRALQPPEEYAKILNTKGPGRLCKALGITRETHNEQPMTSAKSPLYLAEGPHPGRYEIVETTRIGISKGADLPWRFYLKNSDWISAR